MLGTPDPEQARPHEMVCQDMPAAYIRCTGDTQWPHENWWLSRNTREREIKFLGCMRTILAQETLSYKYKAGLGHTALPQKHKKQNQKAKCKHTSKQRKSPRTGDTEQQTPQRPKGMECLKEQMAHAFLFRRKRCKEFSYWGNTT